MKSLGTASVAALRQYVRAAESAGTDISALFTQTDLNPRILDSDDGRINGEQFQRFIHLLCELTHNIARQLTWPVVLETRLRQPDPML